MITDHIYTLEIHIDSRCITKQSLIESIKSFLREYLNKIEWEVDSHASLYHQLTIIGDIVSIDCCHNLIQQIINNKELRYYRVVDEVGDEIRKRAYPILAEIEQRFRAFINKVLVEVLGFDWWAKYTLKEIPESVKQRYNDYKNNQVSPSFLECSDFNHLVNIIRAKVSELPSNKSITKENVDSILENCNTLDEAKAIWNEKTKVISLWDTFSRYFEDTQAWENLAKELDQEVIDARNKVMHHRPIRFYVIEKLKEVKQRLIEIFNSASLELTEEVRIEVQQETETILRSQELRQHFNSSLDSSINRYFEKAKDDINHLDELVKGTRNAIQSPFDKSLISGRSSFEKMFDESIGSARNALKSSFDKSLISGRSSFEKMFDESIGSARNALKNSFDEPFTSMRNLFINSRDTTINSIDLYSQAVDKTINKISSDIKNIASLDKSPFSINFSILREPKISLSLPEQRREPISDRPRISSGIQDQIEAFKRENAFLAKNNPLGLPEQLRKQISDRPKPSSDIQDVIENVLKQRVEIPLETLRKSFYLNNGNFKKV